MEAAGKLASASSRWEKSLVGVGQAPTAHLITGRLVCAAELATGSALLGLGLGLNQEEVRGAALPA